MPLQRETEVHGFKCKFYDDGVVKVGTTAAARFTMRPMPDGDFDTQLLMELVKQKAKGRQLELPAAALATEFTTIMANAREQASSKRAASAASSVERAAATAAKSRQAEKLAAVLAHQQVPDGERPSLELIQQLNQETKLLSMEQVEMALAEAKVCTMHAAAATFCHHTLSCAAMCVQRKREANEQQNHSTDRPRIASLFQAVREAKRLRAA
jgi:hypothetical protein